MEGVEKRKEGRKEGVKTAAQREREARGQEGEEMRTFKKRKQEGRRKKQPKTESERRMDLRHADELISSYLFQFSLIIWCAQLVYVGVWVCV